MSFSFHRSRELAPAHCHTHLLQHSRYILNKALNRISRITIFGAFFLSELYQDTIINGRLNMVSLLKIGTPSLTVMKITAKFCWHLQHVDTFSRECRRVRQQRETLPSASRAWWLAILILPYILHLRTSSNRPLTLLPVAQIIRLYVFNILVTSPCCTNGN